MTTYLPMLIFIISFLITDIFINRKRRACKVRGHEIEVSEDHNLDTGRIESVSLRCKRCKFSIDKVYIKKPELTEKERDELRHGYYVMLKFWTGLNESIKKH